jgi:hypothetical protein
MAQRLIKYGTQAYWLLIMPFAALGFALVARRERRRIILHPAFLYCAAITAVHAVTIALQDRFHYPCNPFLAMFSAGALLVAWDWLFGRLRSPAAAVAADPAMPLDPAAPGRAGARAASH